MRNSPNSSEPGFLPELPPAATHPQGRKLHPHFISLILQTYKDSIAAIAFSSTEDYVPAYDSIFKRSECYNEKLHRDDRAHAKHKGLDLHNEETSRPVPVLSSSEYGRHLHLIVDKVNRDHVRVGVVRLEFFRKSGMSKSLEEGYGCVTPS
ncbi:PREDICTED: uncharacterized protein C5orf49 homolog [Nanorana parkeri]|uniref:uncharacterized protein C5orf49 homolog n=1 Tax=Nanorana parkeri TaxID=125878 RepID=UPI0008547EF7|nr:PREDICTED: uncharacterized protein C5orf49 homolog [Nanorana parkeri]